MAARKNLQNAAPAVDKQKKADEDARLRVKCLEISATVQTLRTNANTIIAGADRIFQYAKTGKLPD